VPEGDQEHRGVAVTMPIGFGNFDQPVDLGLS
jgi:hypothetical protein